jgi:hypothetical protein
MLIADLLLSSLFYCSCHKNEQKILGKCENIEKQNLIFERPHRKPNTITILLGYLNSWEKVG